MFDSFDKQTLDVYSQKFRLYVCQVIKGSTLAEVHLRDCFKCKGTTNREARKFACVQGHARPKPSTLHCLSQEAGALQK